MSDPITRSRHRLPSWYLAHFFEILDPQCSSTSYLFGFINILISPALASVTYFHFFIFFVVTESSSPSIAGTFNGASSRVDYPGTIETMPERSSTKNVSQMVKLDKINKHLNYFDAVQSDKLFNSPV